MLFLRKSILAWLLFFSLFGSWHLYAQKDNPPYGSDELVSEIIQMETSFREMASGKGIAEAFRYFAAEDAVINRGNQLIEGPTAIFAFYNKPEYENAKVTWKPIKVVVAESGDLAFSYGEYVWKVYTGQGEQRSTGIYMTVWKKQDDGSWRYIYD